MALPEEDRLIDDPNTWYFRVGGDDDDDEEGDFIEVKRYISPQYNEHRYAVLTHYGNERGFLGNNFTLEEVEAYIKIVTGGYGD